VNITVHNIETVICSECGNSLIFKAEGKSITVYHSCSVKRTSELIDMIASSIREYPNLGGDKTIMEAVDDLIKRVK